MFFCAIAYSYVALQFLIKTNVFELTLNKQSTTCVSCFGCLANPLLEVHQNELFKSAFTPKFSLQLCKSPAPTGNR